MRPGARRAAAGPAPRVGKVGNFLTPLSGKSGYPGPIAAATIGNRAGAFASRSLPPRALGARRRAPPSAGMVLEPLPSVTQWETSMKNSQVRRMRNRGMTASPRGSSPTASPGFSRPTSARKAPVQHGPRASASARPGAFATNPRPMPMVLDALSRDYERARAYLAQPGCNVLLGAVQLSRAMIKWARIAPLLREDHRSIDGAAVPSIAVAPCGQA